MSMDRNRDAIQLLNTAILKSKERKIDRSYEKRLSETCQGPEMEAFAVAVAFLSEKQKISRDQAAVDLVDTIKKLDSIWTDYVILEGMQKLKEALNQEHKAPPAKPSSLQQTPTQFRQGHL